MREAQMDPTFSDAALASATAPAAVTGFVTAAGVRVSRNAAPFDPALLARITQQADERRGGVLSSGMEYPGRYSRWHVAYVDPCIEIVARGRSISARALNERGGVLLPVIGAALLRPASRRAPDRRAPNQPAPNRPAADRRPARPRTSSR